MAHSQGTSVGGQEGPKLSTAAMYGNMAAANMEFLKCVGVGVGPTRLRYGGDVGAGRPLLLPSC